MGYGAGMKDFLNTPEFQKNLRDAVDAHVKMLSQPEMQEKVFDTYIKVQNNCDFSNVERFVHSAVEYFSIAPEKTPLSEKCLDDLEGMPFEMINLAIGVQSQRYVDLMS